MTIRYQIQPKPPIVQKPITDDDDEDEVVQRPKIIEMGQEMRRILSQETRATPDPGSPEAQELADFLTNSLAKVPNPYPGRLRPLQALALREAWKDKGFFGPLKPGAGKTAIAALLPTVMQLKSIYVCPAAIQVATKAEFSKMRADWHMPTEAQMRVISYELLSNPSSGEERDKEGKIIQQSLLDRIKPQMIILDEGHKAAESGAAITKRLKAYIKENPDTVIIAMSGTFFKTSIKNAAHIMEWALRLRAPVPNDYVEREAWSALLDAKPAGTERPDVGAMVALTARYGYEQDVAGCRMAVGRRIFETPGVIGTQEPLIDVPLSITSWLPSEECDNIHAAFDTLVDTQQLPDGTELADELAMSRHQNTFGLGFYQVYYSHSGFTQCLTNVLSSARSTTASIESRIVKLLSLTKERDAYLVSALAKSNIEMSTPNNGERLIETSRKSTSSNTTDSGAMESRKPSTMPCSPSTTAAVIFAGYPHGTEDLCTSIIATLQDRLGASCITTATSRLEFWEMTLKACPALSSILVQATEAAKPPIEWRKARNEWAKACRKKLQSRKAKVDTEALLKNAVRKGRFPDLEEVLDAWEYEMHAERRRTGFREPPVECVWFSDEAIEEVSKWAQEYQGVIWVQHVGMGERLARDLGIPYYGAGTIDVRSGKRITEHKGGAAAASLAACSTGVNLQRIWHANLWLTAPTEQGLARTHRPGQVNPVSNHVYLGCASHLRSFLRARDVKSEFAEQLTGDSQRLRSATTTMPDAWTLEKRGGARWERK